MGRGGTGMEGELGWVLRFQDGTLVVKGARCADLPTGFIFDGRVGSPRGPAHLYPKVVFAARDAGVPLADARAWAPLEGLHLQLQRTPRPYQQEAIQAWLNADRRGTVVLPTGSGKTLVAELLIAATQRPTLVVAPTLDLVGQWYDGLRATFGCDVGIVGGGHHEVHPITVTTYDSMLLHLPRYGDRFALLVFDEVHHLPAPAYLAAAETSMAPFRLGLTATYERLDGREEELDSVLGEVVYRREIHDLAGDYLSEYEVVRILVPLSEEEMDAYRDAREEYLGFIRSRGISVGGPNGWRRFLRASSRSRAGRSAHKAYRESKRLSFAASGKMDVLGALLARERGRRVLIFSHDNATAYGIAHRYLVPVITHHTPLKERRALLAAFEEGLLPVLATSRVLNEGVDLPTAEVAIVLSGSGTVREHVQRLGRILRPQAGKQAILYEVIAESTSEESTSRRRRQHDAYR